MNLKKMQVVFGLVLALALVLGACTPETVTVVEEVEVPVEVEVEVPDSVLECEEHGPRTPIGYDELETLEVIPLQLQVRVTKSTSRCDRTSGSSPIQKRFGSTERTNAVIELTENSSAAPAASQGPPRPKRNWLDIN